MASDARVPAGVRAAGLEVVDLPGGGTHGGRVIVLALRTPISEAPGTRFPPPSDRRAHLGQGPPPQSLVPPAGWRPLLYRPPADAELAAAEDHLVQAGNVPWERYGIWRDESPGATTAERLAHIRRLRAGGYVLMTACGA